MAQTGYTPILVYASGTATNVPLAINLTSSALGAELALNYADGKLYYKNSSGTVTLLASAAGSLGDVVGPASATDNALARFDLTTGKLIQNSVGILSDTGALSGLTDIAASGSITLSGGTANGVAYLNGSKAVTSGSALVFDGSNLGVGVTPSAWQTGANLKALQVGVGAAFFSDTNSAYLGQNVFQDSAGTSKYINTNFASKYQQSLSVHSWYTAASGTAGNAITFSQAMTLDASGNLGIGTTTPASFGAICTRRGISVAGITGSVSGSFSDGANDTLSISHDSSLSRLTFAALTFNTGTTERARIDSSGNLLVGDTATIGTGGKLQVKSSTDTSIFKCTSSTTYAAIVSNVENTAARLIAFQYGSGGSPTNVGTITTNGTGVTYGTSSDYRLKENIVPMTGALDKVAQLKPVTYKWKINGSDGQGFIAHELAEVVPDAVQGEKDAVDADGNPTYQGIDTSFLVATLTAAIQEQQALITQLTARITALEGA